ncbi:zinc finger, CCHC-type containing LTR copia-type gag-polypeptide, partial [Tanacetum coccineum]
PSLTITVEGTTQSNPEALTWTEVDHRAIILLQSSLTEEAAAKVLGLTTARQIWLSLEATYTNASVKRIHSLRDSLCQITKGTAYVSDYCCRFKGICDQLSAIGHPVVEIDKLHWFLCRLGPSYETFSTAIRATKPAPLFHDLDRTTKRILASGNCENGLYVLKNEPCAFAATTTVSKKASYELWHARLGHVSFDVISVLNKLGVLCIYFSHLHNQSCYWVAHLDAKFFLIYAIMLPTNLHPGVFHASLLDTVLNIKDTDALILSLSRIFVTRDARFNETIFPFSGSSCNTPISSLELTTFLQDIPSHTSSVLRNCQPMATKPTKSPSVCTLCKPPVQDSIQADDPLLVRDMVAVDESSSTQSIPSSHDQSSTDPITSNPILAQAHLPTQTSNRVTKSTSTPSTSNLPPSNTTTSSHPMTTRSKSGIFKPRHIADLASLTTHPLHVALTSISEPKGFKTAAKNPQWIAAMHEELQALQQNQTWTLVPIKIYVADYP